MKYLEFLKNEPNYFIIMCDYNEHDQNWTYWISCFLSKCIIQWIKNYRIHFSHML